MRRFHLLRHEDETGTSGEGVVAEGVVFTDGTAVLHWTTQYKSTAIYHSIEELEKIHGHNGRTEIIWRDKI